MGKKKGGNGRHGPFRPPGGKRRRSISESPLPNDLQRVRSLENRIRTKSENDGKTVRFNLVLNKVDVYPADPSVKLKSKRLKVMRRFDGPEWSLYKALRQRKRSLSRSISESSDSTDESPPSSGTQTTPTNTASKNSWFQSFYGKTDAIVSENSSAVSLPDWYSILVLIIAFVVVWATSHFDDSTQARASHLSISKTWSIGAQ